MPETRRKQRGAMCDRIRRKVLRSLYQQNGGRCVNCRIPCGIVSELVPQGYTLYPEAGLLVGPTGYVLAVATIEHLVPLSKGGGNERNNLTLYCWTCNQMTSRY